MITREEMIAAIDDLVDWAHRQICPHEETHRGGAIWEICSSCGAKWADDEGGKPEFKLPEEVVNAERVSAALQAAEPAMVVDIRRDLRDGSPSPRILKFADLGDGEHRLFTLPYPPAKAQDTLQRFENETPVLPVVNAQFEVVYGGITGITEAPVKRVEVEDDGSLTVVIDHWPEWSGLSKAQAQEGRDAQAYATTMHDGITYWQNRALELWAEMLRGIKACDTETGPSLDRLKAAIDACHQQEEAE